MSEEKRYTVKGTSYGGQVWRDNSKIYSSSDLDAVEDIASVLNGETAPLHARIAELEAAIESAIATAETLLDEPSPYNKVGESVAGWLRRALTKKAGGNE
jgi:hypothetical protein